MGVPDGPIKEQMLLVTLSAYLQLLIMTAPMLLAIVLTRNLGPREGAPRIVALALGMGGIAWAFQEQLDPTLELLLDGLHDTAGP